MKTNEIRKGMRIRLNNGWFATMADNAKGNIRMADVEGLYRETGSVYSHDIVAVRPGPEGTPWQDVEHTPAQVALRAKVFG